MSLIKLWKILGINNIMRTPEHILISVEKSRKKFRNKAFQVLGNRCKICHEPPNFSLKKINLRFHHKYYDETGRTNFIMEIDGWKERGSRLIRAVLKNPETFMLLCKECHKIIELSKLDLEKVQLCSTYLESKNMEK